MRASRSRRWRPACPGPARRRCCAAIEERRPRGACRRGRAGPRLHPSLARLPRRAAASTPPSSIASPPTPTPTSSAGGGCKDAVSRAVVAGGGTISHQHGVGVDHAPYLAAEKGELGLALLRAAARELDPGAMMNPGKLWPDEAAASATADVKVDPHYDLLIVGGGITGAAVLHAASRRGLRTLAGRPRRLRRRHLVVVVEADPRRHALPQVGAVADDARVGARARAVAARATRAGRAAAVRDADPRRQPARAARPRRGLLDRRPHGRPAHRAAHRPGRGAGARAGARPRPPARGDRLPRRRRRRCPAGAAPDLRRRRPGGARPQPCRGHPDGERRPRHRRAPRRPARRHARRGDGDRDRACRRRLGRRGAGRAGAAAAARQPSRVRAPDRCRCRAASPGCIRAIAGRCSPMSGKARCWSARPTSTIRSPTCRRRSRRPRPTTWSRRCACRFRSCASTRRRRSRPSPGCARSSCRRARRTCRRRRWARDSALWTRPGLVGITGGKLTTHRASAAEVLREVERAGLAAGARAGAVAAGSGVDAPAGAARRRRRGLGCGAAGRGASSRSPARPTASPSCAGRCAKSRCAVSTTC